MPDDLSKPSQHALEYSIAKRVMPDDLSKPSQLSSFDGRKQGIVWTNKCCSHVADVLVGLLLHIGDVEQSSET
ncbi:hypothetical protein DPMN_098353 [Dreissena polymorpha]|uniref:Uncharacterized protein n=1 Tax=Dreissena polymorpha TaxID=45954 RepID=A0A9D4LDG3_DREPO|nr:hypothetical protein DPMN_098353 [Dreissena polymorpha]